jgi:hypothetical protein
MPRVAVMAIAATALLKLRRCIMASAVGSGRRGMPMRLNLKKGEPGRANGKNAPGSLPHAAGEADGQCNPIPPEPMKTGHRKFWMGMEQGREAR